MRANWLTPLVQALERLERPVPTFFRDDDAGWATDRLLRLLDLFEVLTLPIDLAVIPAAVTPELAATLRRRMKNSASRLGLHQHGCDHINREPTGRKCEFGNARAQRTSVRISAQARRL